MSLSQDLISQFAKLANSNNTNKNKEATVNGEYKIVDDVEYVQIDGSDIWTPVTSTVEAETGERVKVLIKDHTATVTGNISSPSARTKTVQDLKDEVDEYGNTIQQLDNSITQQANSIIQINDNINQQNNTINQHNNTINQQGNTIQQLSTSINQQGDNIESMNNSIISHGNEITTINNTITQQGNTISQHSNTISQQGNTITQQGNTIRQQGTTLSTFNSEIEILNSGFSIVDGTLTGLSQIVTDELTTNTLNAAYANIDFANIGIAAITKLFTDSGIIRDLVVSQGNITGELVGVTIKGDLIEGNTVKADKLVVLGSDGLYYKLNVSSLGETTASSDAKYQNGLDGSVIIAQSIVAEKISVDDLVAFDATIGGFNIGNHSIYSGAKSSVSNTTRGLYLDDNGQIAIGDSSKYIKYYLNDEDQYCLDIKADVITLGNSGNTLSDELDSINDNIESSNEQNQTKFSNANESIQNAQIAINSLKGIISNLVTDANGSSLMTQNGNGWTFNISNITSNLESIQSSINNIETANDNTDHIISSLTNLINDLNNRTAYINMVTDEIGRPCIVLGKSDSLFKIRITNEAIDFLEGSSKIAYANNNTFYTEMMIVKRELQIGENSGYVLKKRANGNLGLSFISN